MGRREHTDALPAQDGLEIAHAAVDATPRLADAVDAADDFFATFVGGDTNNNNMLDLAEVWSFEASRVATVGSYQNIAVATGNDANGTQVGDTDPSNHQGVALPAIIGKRGFLASAFR